MSTTRYIISDASKQVDVEPHVLRYWEEELQIEIPRNEMGHRYYNQEHIDTFKTVKTLKDQGFQLKAIKMLVSELHNIENLDSQSILKLREELNEKALQLEEKDEVMETGQGAIANINEETDDKMGQFQNIMYNLIMNALQENNSELTEQFGSQISDSVIKEMDYLLRLKEEREEERFKRLDEVIRGYQKGRAEIAATQENKRRKKGIFRKNR